MAGNGEYPAVIPLLQHEEDRNLLDRCRHAINPGAENLFVSPLGRVGFSGSRLYIGWAADDAGGLANVIKVNDTEDIDEEIKALKLMYTFFTDARDFRHVPGEERSAIVYNFIARDRGTRTEEFKDIAFQDVENPDADESLTGVLTALYSRCCEHAHGGKRCSVVLGEEYRRYWRDKKNDRASAKLGLILGSETRSGRFPFLNANIRDPREVRESIKEREIEVLLADAVHGDLHPNNIVIDRDGGPRLIDFAWGHCKSHVLKDFVLLECSLRFLMFPSHPELDTQLEVDAMLLEEAGTEGLLGMAAERPLADHYRRLGAMLRTVREFARQASGDNYDFDEYLAAQFCVLYGLLSYPEYHVYLAVRALGLIADRLESGGGG